MLQGMDGAVLLVAGGWVWLVAFGKIRLRRDDETIKAFRRKYGLTLSILGVLLMALGLFRLALFILAGVDQPL